MFVRAVSSCSFQGAIQLGQQGDDLKQHAPTGEAPAQTCRDRGTGGAMAELFSSTVIAT